MSSNAFDYFGDAWPQVMITCGCGELLKLNDPVNNVAMNGSATDKLTF
ncbi:hypothetical protein QWZ13_05090 [Reinekea marina]|nr:hypothetical protein [Reinekea marina]MDN3648283.1 hypothetical protein [Reinekea marina]